MFYTLIFFFLDFVFFSLFNKWIIHTLLIYFIFKLFSDPKKVYSFDVTIFPLFLILLQDQIINGHFGASLIYFLPLILIFNQLQRIVNFPRLLQCFFLFFVFFSDYLLKKFIYLNKVSAYSTFRAFFINLIIEILSLIILGIWGNRSVFK